MSSIGVVGDVVANVLVSENRVSWVRFSTPTYLCLSFVTVTSAYKATVDCFLRVVWCPPPRVCVLDASDAY